MSTSFNLPPGIWDDHIHGDGLHIGLTRSGFDRPDLDVAHRTLVETGHRIDDGGLEITPHGSYGELAIDRHPTKKAEKRLRGLGFTGVDSLLA